jgi:chromosome segregation ATPase
MSRKIKDILIFNKEINSMKSQLQKSKNEQKSLEQKIKEVNRELPSLNTDLNINKHKYSELLEENQKMKKENFVLNEKMYEEIIDYGNKIKILEGRKEKLKKVREEQMENLKKEEKIKNLEKEKRELKREAKIIEEENDDYEKLINEFLTHLNLNYINLINLKQLIEPINQSEINIENYILNKNEQCQIIENQIENIINKYY